MRGKDDHVGSVVSEVSIEFVAVRFESSSMRRVIGRKDEDFHLFLFVDFFNGFLSRDGGDLLFESFDGGEELEDHHEDEEESGEDDGIHIALDADDFREGITDAGEGDDDSHAAPDDEAHEELEHGLPALILPIIGDALIEHEGSDDEDDDLIEGEGHRSERLGFRDENEQRCLQKLIEWTHCLLSHEATEEFIGAHNAHIILNEINIFCCYELIFKWNIEFFSEIVKIF